MIDPNIKKKADDIRNKVYGKEVRESLASGLEAMSSDVVENEGRQSVVEGRQDSVESQWQNVVDETTNLDVVSAPEIIAARNGEANLKTRLDEEHQEVTAQLDQTVRGINYKMFGAAGDGVTDDTNSIKRAHDYANQHNMPVVNLSGKYLLASNETINIKNSVYWGDSIFVVDESISTIEPRFLVESKKERFDVVLGNDKTSFLNKFKKGVTKIEELSPYKNNFIVMQDANTKVGVRYGYEESQGLNKTDMFFIGEGGRIIGEPFWDVFNDYTSMVAYPVDDSYLTIEGGIFYLNGVSNESLKNKLVYNGIEIRRSRVIVKNQSVRIKEGNTDNLLNIVAGFYYINYVYDVEFDNINVVPRVRFRDDGESVSEGTYGIGGRYILDLKIKNVESEGVSQHWGVFGMNFVKNAYVEKSRLNRFDVHFQAQNIYLDDVIVGEKGIVLTGGGDLFLNNVIKQGGRDDLETNEFIEFRRDYGSRWDGDIKVTKSKLIMDRDIKASVLSFNPWRFDHKYQLVFGHSVVVDDFVIDYTNVINSQEDFMVITTPKFGNIGSERIIFPEYIKTDNVRVRGREKGVKVIHLYNINQYQMSKKGGYDEQNKEIIFNSRIIINDVDTAISSDSLLNSEVFLTTAVGNEPLDDFSMYPNVRITNCGNISFNTHESPVKITVRNCKIDNFKSFNGGNFRSKVIFENCSFYPRLDSSQIRAYDINILDESIRFVSCEFGPLKSGQQNSNNIALTNFHYENIFEPNVKVKHIHVGSTIGVGLKSLYESNELFLNKDFYSKLQNQNSKTLGSEVAM